MSLTTRQIDNLDKLPPERIEAGRVAPWYKPEPRKSWDVILAQAAGACLVSGFAYGLAWLAAPAVAPFALFGAGAIGGGLYAWAWWQKNVKFERVRGVPVAASRLARVDPAAAMDAGSLLAGLLGVDQTYAGAVVPAQQTYSPTFHQAVSNAAPALAAPIEAPAPTIAALPPSEWLAWFDTRPHGLLAAETGGGKSTTAKAILKSRIERGEMVFILDPHSSDWFGLPSIGGGEDWGAVWIGMQVVLAEYVRRLQARDAFLAGTGRELPHNHFPRITVLLDEGNLTYKALSKKPKPGAKSPWEQFTPTIGSGARKVSMSGLILVQSALVEDIGLSGSMRQNYTRLALDAATTRLMVRNEEMDQQRKKDLFAALAGLSYPATSVQDGRVVLLDRTGMDRISPPANASAALWTEGYARVESLLRARAARQTPPARPPVASVRPSGVESVSIRPPMAPVRTDGRTDGDKTLAYLRAFVRMGKSREQARAILSGRGIEFENKAWTEARRMEGKG